MSTNWTEQQQAVIANRGGTLLVSAIISLSAPVAAVTTMFSSKFGGGDTALSVDMVSLSTVLSIITMPAVITLAQLLA